MPGGRRGRATSTPCVRTRHGEEAIELGMFPCGGRERDVFCRRGVDFQREASPPPEDAHGLMAAKPAGIGGSRPASTQESVREVNLGSLLSRKRRRLSMTNFEGPHDVSFSQNNFEKKNKVEHFGGRIMTSS